MKFHSTKLSYENYGRSLTNYRLHRDVVQTSDELVFNVDYSEDWLWTSKKYNFTNVQYEKEQQLSEYLIVRKKLIHRSSFSVSVDQTTYERTAYDFIGVLNEVGGLVGVLMYISIFISYHSQPIIEEYVAQNVYHRKPKKSFCCPGKYSFDCTSFWKSEFKPCCCCCKKKKNKENKISFDKAIHELDLIYFIKSQHFTR